MLVGHTVGAERHDVEVAQEPEQRKPRRDAFPFDQRMPGQERRRLGRLRWLRRLEKAANCPFPRVALKKPELNRFRSAASHFVLERPSRLPGGQSGWKPVRARLRRLAGRAQGKNRGHFAGANAILAPRRHIGGDLFFEPRPPHRKTSQVEVPDWRGKLGRSQAWKTVVADCVSQRRNWAESCRNRVAWGRTGVRAIAVVPLRGRSTLHRPKRSFGLPDVSSPTA